MQYTRLCGCYNDDIPLELFTSNEIQKELFAYDYLQESIVEKCEQVIETTKLKETLTKLKLKPECIVRRPIDTKMKLKFQNLSNYDNIMRGEKLPVKTLKEAKEYVQQEYQAQARVYIKENPLKIRFTENNIRNAKVQLKNKGFKSIQVINDKRLQSLYKNPEFVTKTHKNVDIMISENNGYISLFIKNRIKINPGDLFLFQTPQGTYLAKSGSQEDLEEMFKGHYQLTM